MGLISRVSSRTYRKFLFYHPKKTKKMAEAQKQTKLRAATLRGKKREDLESELVKYRQELATLRVAKVTSGGASKLCKIKSVRKSIAKVLTVMNQAQELELQKFYRGKSIKPADLKPRKTRALRRRLNKAEEGAQRLKAIRRRQRTAGKKYALKA